MYTKTWLLLFLCLSVTCCIFAESNFGYVNIADALMLHPYMKDFHVRSNRFDISALGKESVESQKRQEQELQAEIKVLEDELVQLRAERQMQQDEYVRELQQLVRTRKKAAQSSDFSAEQYNDRRRSVDRDFQRKLRDIDQKTGSINEQIAELENEIRYSGKSSPEETNRVFSLMIDDIHEATEVVADYYDISFVFNSSFEFARSPVAVAIANPLGSFFGELDQRLSLDEEGDITMVAELKGWLNSRNSYLSTVSDRRLYGFILRGGLDMTPAVIDYVYRKHDIGETQREFIQDFYNRIVAQER